MIKAVLTITPLRCRWKTNKYHLILGNIESRDRQRDIKP